ncbi:MAG: NAD(P)/FAD-dependent oxidoreductase [Thermoprotei archaeon]
MVDVVVVGGGPAGLITSLYVKGLDVVLFEEHSRVGYPKHCAGFVSRYTAARISRIASSRVLDHRYRVLSFYTPRGRYIMEFKTPLIYHVNRPLFEEKLLDKVLAKGIDVYLGVKAKPSTSPSLIRVGNGEVRARYIVASDGAHSIFRKALYRSYNDYLIGVQYVYRTSGLDDDVIHIIYDNYTPDFFQWIAPIDTDKVLLGFATRKYTVHPEVIASKSLKKIGITPGSRIEVFGGLIPRDKPLDNPVIEYRDTSVVFIGDSVPHIKPYTGGGLSLITTLAPLLGDSISRNRLLDYKRVHRALKYRLLVEYSLTSFFEKNNYWIPADIVNKLYRFKLLEPVDYDNHYRLVVKSLPLTLYFLLSTMR